ncbi:ROK family transcriptional regulator [Pontiella sulfatireligans]|uniref:N-acetylglucosamine repressor n=1 Tax=Pontiella sulfatireligans TaxID=2750658 RepID=A0A6C2UJA9_9BACT|nr:ROK family protein [Pontiella sulfatireligans]VGO19286.1 N-acetylglucosamine repressor [Pontiella sulfatireligans]
MQRFTDKKADQVTVRRLNMAAILKLLRERGTLARADLAKELGMTRNTASNIVTDLLTAGLVVETEFRRVGAGRPGLLLELAHNGGFAIGAEIDISRIIVVAVDFKGKTLWRESAQINPKQAQTEIIATAEKLVRDALDWGNGENLKPLGIGVGLAGLVDAEGGTLVYAPTLGWKNLPLKQMWEKQFSVPVYLSNEANTAALGYYNYADRSKAQNLAYLSIGVGMAAGLMLEGHLFGGTGGFAGQAGHMKIRPDGEPCSCGDHGCWITEVGLTALSRKTGGQPVKPDETAQALRDGDAQLTAVVAEMAEMLGIGIVNFINLFNFDTVILGGAMRPILPFMLEKARSVVDQRALKHPRANVRIKVSGRDDDSVFGAACLVLDSIMNDPIPLVRSMI